MESAETRPIRRSKYWPMEPIPIPEPPRVIYTRPFVPDASMTSEMHEPLESHFHHHLEQLTAKVNNLKLQYHHPHFNQLPPINLPTVKPTSILKTHSHPSQTTKSDSSHPSLSHIYDLLKKHDEKLDFISRQIEKLLQDKKPEMRSVETMTTSSLAACEPSRSPRFIAPKDDPESRTDYYDYVSSRISDLLSRSSTSDSGFEFTPSPKKAVSRRPPTPESPSFPDMDETIYINRLAEKYLTPDPEPVHYDRAFRRDREEAVIGHYAPSRASTKTKRIIDSAKSKNRPRHR